ncbi:MAG TPA: hypothetical protein VEA60_15785 [Allosphingosinicella sp.]|nr:hypothetical protein [Allosphingosinicella sp.]
MPLALILATSIAAASPAEPPVARSSPPVDRSLSESDRLRELEIAVGSAYDKGQIDGKTAEQFYLGIARVRRQMVLMGMQFGYRQRVRLRARIDGLYARLAQRRSGSDTQIRSGK